MAEAVAVGDSVAVEVAVVVPAGSAIAGKRSKNAIFHGVPSWDGTPFILRMMRNETCRRKGLIKPLISALDLASMLFLERLDSGRRSLQRVMSQADQRLGFKRFRDKRDAPTSYSVTLQVLVDICRHQNDMKILCMRSARIASSCP